MKTLIHHIRYESRSDVFRFYPLPDLHLGNVACDEVKLTELRDRIAGDPFARWCGMGDYGEFINRKDRRYDEEAVAPWLHGHADLVEYQKRRILELFKPIGKQCVGLVEGNHERTIYRWNDRDIYADIVAALDAPNRKLLLGPCGFIRLLFHRRGETHGTWGVDIFVTHGWWAGRQMGNGALQLEKLAGWVRADIVLAGHDHKTRAFTMSTWVPLKTGDVEKRDLVCGSCGTFLDGAKYGMEAGYRPQPIRWLELIIEPDKRSIRVLQ